MLSKPPLPRKYHYCQNIPRVFTVASLLPSLLRWRISYTFTLTSLRFYAEKSTLLRWRIYAFTLTSLRFYADESAHLRWRMYAFTLTNLRFYADESTILRWRVYDFTLTNLRFYADASMLTCYCAQGRRSPLSATTQATTEQRPHTVLGTRHISCARAFMGGFI